MDRRTLTFIALAITILFGAGFAALAPAPRTYTVIGGALVALCWIAVGMFGRDDPESAAPQPPNDAPQPPDDPTRPPYGTPPEDQL